MKSLYSEYIQEREGLKTYELKDGFFTYEFSPDLSQIYIADMYIRAEKRCFSIYKKFIDEVISLARNTKTLLCSVDASTANCEYILSIHLKMGMKIREIQGTRIFLEMEICDLINKYKV